MNKGFVLVVVLIYILVLSGLCLVTMKVLKQALRLQGFYSSKLIEANATLNLLRDIERNPALKCVKPIIASFVLIHKSSIWWQQNSCVKDKYFYYLEDLHVDFCADINGFAAHYYRATVIKFPERIQDSRIVLQSIFITASNEKLNCSTSIHAVTLGEQMFRQL